MRKSAIPLLAGAAGVGGLVLTSGACKADRSLDPDDFLGVWNAVEQTYIEYGEAQTYDMPVLQIQNYGGMTICSGYFVDLEFRADGTANMTYGGTYYGSCDPSDIYSYGYEVEWEDLADGKLGIFGEGVVAVSTGYVEEGSIEGGMATFTESGTGFSTSTSGEETSGEPPPDNLPIPLPTRARELLMTCTPGGGRLLCEFDDVDSDGFNIAFGRPACSSDPDCSGAGEVCFAQQCVVPRGYDYNGEVGNAPVRRRAGRSFGKLFANK